MPTSIGSLTQFEFDQHGGQHWHRVSIRTFADGQREASITRYKTLSELPTGYDPFLGWQSPSERTQRGSGDRESSIKRASRRARSTARIRCKASGFDSLFTFTYRENVQDRELVASHWAKAVRAIKRLIPDFAYVAVIERQKRGALHLHVATHRLPPSFVVKGVMVKSWNVLRAIWRRVVGDLGGNFDESRRKRNSRVAGAGVAKYITKYIAKDFEDGELNKKRFWAGGPWQAPQRVTMLFSRPCDRDANGDPVRLPADLVALVVDELACSGGELSLWLSPDGLTFWMAAAAPR